MSTNMVERGRSSGQDLGPIQKWEIPGIVEAADNLLREGCEATSHALPTEAPVGFPASTLDESLLWDADSGLTEEGVLLPVDDETPSYAQEIWSSWFYESLCNRMRSAETEGKSISADDVREFQRQFQRRELNDDTRSSIASWEHRGHDVDFSLEQVLDTATHRMLAGRDSEDQAHKDRRSGPAVQVAYSLLQQAVAEGAHITENDTTEPLGRLTQSYLYLFAAYWRIHGGTT